MSNADILKIVEYSACLNVRRPLLWQPFEAAVSQLKEKSGILIYEGMLGMGGKWFVCEVRRALRERESVPVLSGDDILQGKGGGVFFAEYFQTIEDRRKIIFFRALESLLKEPGTLIVINQNRQGYEPHLPLYRSLVRKIALPVFTERETKEQMARLGFREEVPVQCLTGGNPWVNSLIAMLGPEKGIDFAYDQIMERLSVGTTGRIREMVSLYSALQEKEIPVVTGMAAQVLQMPAIELENAQQEMVRQYCLGYQGGHPWVTLPLQKIILSYHWFRRRKHDDSWGDLEKQVEEYRELMGEN